MTPKVWDEEDKVARGSWEGTGVVLGSALWGSLTHQGRDQLAWKNVSSVISGDRLGGAGRVSKAGWGD